MKPLKSGRDLVRSIRRRLPRGRSASDRPPGESRGRAEPDRVPSRAAYLATPSPIEDELRGLFGREDRLTIFDIGSCEGEDAIRYARLFPNARVVAFEPLATNLAILRANVARHAADGRIQVVEAALWDRDGTATFYVSSGQPSDRPPAADWDYGNKSSSLLPPLRHLEIHPWVRFDEQVEVRTERFDNACARLGIETVDFVHLDVQGAELAVLAGAGAFLDRVRAVWMEVEAIPLYRDQPVKPDVAAFMADRGFVVVKDTVGEVAGDQLWVAPRSSRRETEGPGPP